MFVYEIFKNISISDNPGLDRHDLFPHTSGGADRNVIIYGVDMSSSTKIDTRKKYTLILGKGPAQGLEHTLNAEKNVFN